MTSKPLHQQKIPYILFTTLLLLTSLPLTTSVSIPNLQYQSQAGLITITYNGATPYNVGPLHLSFSLAQNSIAGNWGSPWLNWQLVDQVGSNYEYINQADLANGQLQPGQVITFQYSPVPWNNQAAASNIAMTTVAMGLAPVSISSSLDSSQAWQRTLTIINTSGKTLNLNGAAVQFTVAGDQISSVWGAPWVAWTVSQSGNLVTLMGPSSGAASLAPQAKLTIIWSGTSSVSNVMMSILQEVSGDPPVNNNSTNTTTNNTQPSNNTNPTNSSNNGNNTSNNNNTSSNNNSSTTNDTNTSNNTNTNNNTNSNNSTSNNNSTNSTNNSSQPSNNTSNGKLYVGYYQTWSDPWVSSAANSKLANLPAYVNVVNLAFVKPDCQYTGNLDLSGTGLQFSSDASVVKASIATLKAKNPNTKVIIAVGGATYWAWSNLNAPAIAKLVVDLGLDGVDIDYEPSSPSCSVVSGKVKCTSDQELQNVVIALRNALPRPYMLTAAAFSVGAYGEPGTKFTNSQPVGSAYTGLFVNLLKSQYGSYIDLINIMSYDASSVFNPIEAYQAYKYYYNGPVVIGVEVPPEAWGGHVISMTELATYTSYVNNNNGAGMMIWSLQKTVNGAASATNPSANMISQAICTAFGLPSCSQALNV